MMTHSSRVVALACALGLSTALFFSGGFSAAHAKSSKTQFSVKQLIRTVTVGVPVRLDRAKPSRWKKVYDRICRRAAAGSVPATAKLGWLTVYGAGTPADTDMASSLLKRAGAHGDLGAQKLSAIFHSAQDRLPACLTDIPQYRAKRLPVRSDSIAPRRLARTVSRLARRYKVDPRLVMTIARIESGFRSQVVSPQQATGLMQLMPATAKRFGVKDSRNWVQNLAGGMAYLRWLLAYYEGDVVLVVAAYNSGEGNVNKYGGVPPFQETMDYVAKVRAMYHRDWHPFNAKIMKPSPALAKIKRQMAESARVALK